MDKEVKIEMVNGKFIPLNKLTQADLPNVKLSVKNGQTHFVMKTVVIKEDDRFYVERRLFKWTTMEKLVCYDLKVPKTMEAFREIASEKDILDYAIGNYCIEMDKLNSGTIDSVNPVKQLDKIVSALVKKGVPLDVAEQTVANTRKALLSQGFGK